MIPPAPNIKVDLTHVLVVQLQKMVHWEQCPVLFQYSSQEEQVFFGSVDTIEYSIEFFIGSTDSSLESSLKFCALIKKHQRGIGKH